MTQVTVDEFVEVVSSVLIPLRDGAAFSDERVAPILDLLKRLEADFAAEPMITKEWASYLVGLYPDIIALVPGRAPKESKAIENFAAKTVELLRAALECGNDGADA